ncbi:MAG: M48 family metallopeptidase [Acetobacteraceae bacterium]|nr:M48 family metallopeptidase [Acetobacteraceae bacterium]
MRGLPDSIALPTGLAPVTWRRSKRARRISLRIEPRAGGVVVTLPPRATVAAGHALLLSHTGWVAERLARLPRPIRLENGATVPIGGQTYRIRHRPGLRGGVWLEGDELHVTGEPDFTARRVIDFLRSEARRRLAALSQQKAAQAGLTARRVVVKDTTSRWGSCTADGTLMFSWRLIMAPPEIQDYVVAHEVAHLRHMDHSRAFWALTAQLTRHRRAATAWLAAHGAGLMRVG